jgi:hypothetical protein
LRVWCESEEFTLLSETANLSRGGLFLRTSSTAPPAGPFKVTIDALGVVASVEARWSQRGPEAGVPGMGVAIVGFERGATAFHDYVDRLSTRSGEHRISWPAPEGDPGDPGGDSGGSGSSAPP